MNKQIENLIKKIALKDVQLKIAEKRNKGYLVPDILIEILQEVEKEYETNNN